MPEDSMEELRYPTGRFKPKGAPLTGEERTHLIDRIAALPGELREAVAGLDDEQLEAPYRDGGWSVRQVAHHIPDSHLNGYVRFKLGLTEEVPTIGTYLEGAWADLPDTRKAPVEMSLDLLESLHRRWVVLLRSLTPGDFARVIDHPENGKMELDALLSLYAWHGHHHVTQIVELRRRKGW